MQISLVTHRIIETFINPKCTLVCQTISHPSIHWHYQHTHTHKQNGDHLTSQIHQTLKKKRRTYSRCLVDTLSNDIFMQMKPYDDFCCCTLMFPLPSGFLLFIFSLLLLVLVLLILQNCLLHHTVGSEFVDHIWIRKQLSTYLYVTKWVILWFPSNCSVFCPSTVRVSLPQSDNLNNDVWWFVLSIVHLNGVQYHGPHSPILSHLNMSAYEPNDTISVIVSLFLFFYFVPLSYYPLFY